MHSIVSPYGVLLLFVYKNIDKLHMCIDYHALNQQKLNIFPIPYIADLLNCLGHAHFFSSVDLDLVYLDDIILLSETEQ